MAAVALLFASAARQSSLPPHCIMKRVGNLNRSRTSRYTKRYLIRVRWTKLNMFTRNDHIDAKKRCRCVIERKRALVFTIDFNFEWTVLGLGRASGRTPRRDEENRASGD
jgi:hypothetical protein